MPGGDRTGPWGMGPLTGRGAGYCAGYGLPGYMNPVPGRAFGFGCGRSFGGGRGGGRGWRHWYWATGFPGWARGAFPFEYMGYAHAPGGITREQEVEALREQADYLRQSLEDVTARIEELEAKADKDK